MDAGDLDRKITIETNTPTQDSRGEPQDSWSTFASVWARRRDMRGREFFEARASQSEAEAVFTIRWLAGVTAEMRISESGGETWRIVAPPVELGRREALELYCARLET